LVDVNVKGFVNGIRACVPCILARSRDVSREAHVVITGSIGGLIASLTLGAYSGSKAALAAIAETLYLDLAASKSPIGVSLLAQGTQYAAESLRPSVTTRRERGRWQARALRCVRR